MPSKKVRAKLRKQNNLQNNDQNNLKNNSSNTNPLKNMQNIANKMKPMYDDLNLNRKNCIKSFSSILEFLNKTKLSLSEIKEIEQKMKYKAMDDAYIENNNSLIQNLPNDTLKNIKDIGQLWNESESNPLAYTKLEEIHTQVTPVFLKIHMDLAGHWINYIKTYKTFQKTIIDMSDMINPQSF